MHPIKETKKRRGEATRPHVDSNKTNFLRDLAILETRGGEEEFANGCSYLGPVAGIMK